jgi:ribosomal protein L37E
MAPLPLRCAVQGFAALRRRESQWVGKKEAQKDIVKSAGAWHFTFDLQEWFCVRCGRTSDHVVHGDAQIRMALLG